MSRLLLALTLSVLPVRASGPTLDPPSSLEPSEEPGEVRLSHEHRRLVTCEPEPPADAGQPGLRCEAQLETVRAGTTLTLRPVDAAGQVIEGDRRKPVAVRFDRALGVAATTVELAPGVWEVVWAGFEGPARFGVAEGDEFGIRLSTLSGACAPEAGRCVLRPNERQKSVHVPPDRRVER